ncbi:MAG: hypothetical protein CVU79_03950 [Elusimicrobia bacterium HGW-Elusimicrobia-3]|nr:MAG: hypothetical protein CVU79_03950 [Elusimicrobia bacterium HGW-Elusimicrobia-3]
MKKLILAIAIFLGASPLWAELMTYQGRLKESDIPVSANRVLLFEFCDAETAGTCYTTPSGYQSFAVQNGLFKSTFAVPTSDLSQGQWFLQVSVGPDIPGVQILTPRERLTAVPYSVFASSAAYAAGALLKAGDTMTGQLTVSGSTFTVIGPDGDANGGLMWVSTSVVTPALFVSTTGRVGLGTSAPGRSLHIVNNSGQVALLVEGRDATATSIYVESKSGGKPAHGYVRGGTLKAMTSVDSSNRFQIEVPTEPRLTITPAGLTGIGTETPDYQLHVSSAAGEAGTIMAVSTGTSNLFWVAGDGAHATRFYGDGSGLSGVTGATDGTKVLKAGDTMTGPLQILSDDLLNDTSDFITTGIVISTGGAIRTTGVGHGMVAGNARGLGAVDLQTVRTTSDQVAVGDYSTVSGGIYNKANEYGTSVGGGYQNLANTYYATVGGGFANTAQGHTSVVSGGGNNAANGQMSSVSGGSNNTASGDYSLVAGGESNLAFGTHAAAGGGKLNRANGLYSTVPGGYNNTAEGNYSFAAGAMSSSTAQGAFTWQDSGGSTINLINGVTDRTVFKSRGGFLVTGSTNTSMSGTLDRGVIMTGNGLLGVAINAPQAALDVVSTGTASTVYSQIWRDGDGVVRASVTATGVFYGDGSGLTGVTGATGTDPNALPLAGGIMQGAIDMDGNYLAGVSTITMLNGSIAIVPAGTGGTNVGYGISIGSNAYSNSDSGIGIGYGAYLNSYYSVGLGAFASENGSNAVGIGAFASRNYNNGVGVGGSAAENFQYGTGLGFNAANNDNYGLGVGAYAQNNDNYAVGVGAYSQYNAGYGAALGAYSYASSSATALGAQAKANAELSMALGYGTVNDSTGTASFGSYGVSAPYYQVTGSTVLALGGGLASNTLKVGPMAGAVSEGQFNVFVGSAAGKANSSGIHNVLVGHGAGSANITGTGNTFIGSAAGSANVTGLQNIVIGYNQQTSASNSASELNIGGLLFGQLGSKTVGISTRTPQAALDIVSTGKTVNDYAQIWRDSDGVTRASVTATGVFYGDGSGLANVTASGAVQKIGDVMTGPLTINSPTLAQANDFVTTGIVISTGGAIQTTGLGHGTAAGNARGMGAVDLQTYRAVNTEVAGGYMATLSGGYSNTASGYIATVSGGQGNTASGAWYPTVSGGYYNTASGNYAAVSGGQSNTASYSFATVSGGYYNTASNTRATVSGGESNTANGSRATVSGGVGNTASGSFATVSGGSTNTALGQFSWAGGNRSSSTADGAFTWSDSKGYEIRNITVDRTLFKNEGGFMVAGSTVAGSAILPGNQGMLDIISTGTTVNQYAQVWRDSDGVAKASVTATGVYYGDGSGLTGVTSAGAVQKAGDTMQGTLDMDGNFLAGVSTITMLSGSIAIVPPGTAGSNAGYGISIGSFSFNNHTSGVGLGHTAATNNNYGVGVGYGASSNYSSGVGVGNAASNNHNSGVGVGNSAFENRDYGVGVGYSANYNFNYGVGLGANANNNDGYAVGVGAYSANNKGYGAALGAYSYASSSATALGAQAKANAELSMALGYGTINDSTGTASFGNYAVHTSTAVNAAYYQINGSTVLAKLQGLGSLGVGISAGAKNAGAYNTFLGINSGSNNTTGGNNTFLGSYSGLNNAGGLDNTFVGSQAGQFNTSGRENSFLGVNAGDRNTTGKSNSYFGYKAGDYNAVGAGNTVMGSEAAYGVFNNSFSSSTIIGYRAGYGITTGSDNIFFGWQAGYDVTTGTGNIVIGYDEDTSAPGANNELNIGGLLYGDLEGREIYVGRGAAVSTITPYGFFGSGAGLTGVTASDPTKLPLAGGNMSGQLTTASTITVQGNAFSVGASTFVVNAGRVGINWISPEAALQVSGGAKFLSSAGTSYILTAGSSARPDMFFVSSGGIVGAGDFTDVAVDTFAVVSLAPVLKGGADSAVGLHVYARTDKADTIAATGPDQALAGGNFEAAAGGDDSVTLLAGLRAQVRREAAGAGGGTVSKAYGLIVDDIYTDSGAGVITDTYGIYIGNQTSAFGGMQTNLPYAIYSQDPGARTYLAGSLGLGGVDPVARLDLMAAASDPDTFGQIWRNSAGDIVSSMSATGVMMASRFVGDGSGLANLSGVQKTGDTMTGALTISGSSLTIRPAAGAAYSLYISSADGVAQALTVRPGGELYTAGRVGIGSAAPTEALDISGRVLISTRAGGNPSTDGLFSEGSSGMMFQSGGGTYMNVAYGGNYVSIGPSANVQATTNSPRLQVTGSMSVGSTYNSSKPPANSLVVQGRLGAGTSAPDAALSVVQSDVAGSSYTVHIGTSASAYHLVVTTGGWVGLNTMNPHAPLHLTAATKDEGIVVEHNSSTSEGSFLALLKARGTASSQNLVQDGDNLGVLAFGGYNAAPNDPFPTAAAIVGRVDGIPSVSPALDMPGRLEFMTAADGTTDMITRMVIRNDGGVGISTGTPQAMLDIRSTSTLAQIWRDGGGVARATMTADGTLYANIDGLADKVSKAGDFMFGPLSIAVANIDTEPFGLITTGLNISTSGALQTQGFGDGTATPGSRGMGAVDLQTNRSNSAQVASGDYSVIAGGWDNTANGTHSAVVGGWWNVANSAESFIGGGGYNTADGAYGVIAGGYENKMDSGADMAFIGGGKMNRVTPFGLYSAVVGGSSNTVAGEGSFIGGGAPNSIGNPGNKVYSNFASIVGGSSNTIDSAAYWGFIGGGSNNQVSDESSVIGGGDSNLASGYDSSVLGGLVNKATGDGTAIGGGALNMASGNYSTVPGGYQNTAKGAYSFAAGFKSSSTAAGTFTWADSQGVEMLNGVQDQVRFKARGGFLVSGSTNTADPGFFVSGDGSVTMGNGLFISRSGAVQTTGPGTGTFPPDARDATAVDLQNKRESTIQVASGYLAVISGGGSNRASGNRSSVAGGYNNLATSESAVISGGYVNRAGGMYSVVPGGAYNEATSDYSFAAGRSAQSAGIGAFTWADSRGVPLFNNVQDRVWFKASGGFLVSGSTNTADPGLFVSGAGRVAVGATSLPVNPARLQVNGDLGLGNGNLTGNAPVVIWLQANNLLLAGDAVVAAGNNQADKFAAASNTAVIGVAVETINGLDIGRIAVSGVAAVNCVAGTAGQHAVTNGVTAGAVDGTPTPASGASLGVFLENCGNSFAGKAFVLLGR